MAYKEEFDGLQVDAFFQKGYTYQIFMFNDPAPKSYLSKRLSPLRAIVGGIFDTVEDKHYQ